MALLLAIGGHSHVWTLIFIPRDAVHAVRVAVWGGMNQISGWLQPCRLTCEFSHMQEASR
jgi:hypothetical protein